MYREDVMRFLIITKDLLTGGAERVAASQANILSRVGHSVHLLIIEGGKIRYDVVNQVYLHPLNFLYERSKKTRFIEHKRLAQKIDYEYSFIEKEYGVIDGAFVHYHAGFARYLRKKERFAFWLHNPYPIEHVSFFDKWKNRKNLSNGNLVAVSNFIKETCFLYDNKFFNDIPVIFNPFDKDEIREAAQEACEIPSYEYIVGCGRLNIEHKGWDWLILAYKKSKIPVNLVIVGDGEDKRVIEELIVQEGLESRVKLVGGKDNPYPWIKHAKSLILPSYYEGFGNVLVESLILGTPVISSDCGGPEDIMTDELSHWVMPTGDVDALAGKIQEFYNAPYVVQEHHISKYDVSSLVSDLEELALKSSNGKRK